MALIGARLSLAPATTNSEAAVTQTNTVYRRCCAEDSAPPSALSYLLFPETGFPIRMRDELPCAGVKSGSCGVFRERRIGMSSTCSKSASWRPDDLLGWTWSLRVITVPECFNTGGTNWTETLHKRST